MQRCLLLCLALLSPQVTGLRHHHPQAARKRVRELPVATTAAPSNRDFAFDLFRALVAASPNENIIFSPLSISVTLGMIALGAGSHTKAQILEGLQEGREEDEVHRVFHQLLQELGRPREDLQLSLGNALFIKPAVHVHDAFLSAVRTLYLADTFPTNFEEPEVARKQINDYVAKETKGKIVDLVKSFDGTEVMVMVNYIFFKAKWETSFDSKSTQKHAFRVTAEKVVRVPMMRREDRYLYLQDRGLACKVVGVPYQGNATAFFVLPNEGQMEKLEAGLHRETLRKWLKMSIKRKLLLYLPKFSIESSYKLENVLPTLGIRDVFTSHADLTALTNQSNIWVSEMVHKAVVEVDEAGTKAAAATEVTFAFRSALTSSQTITFNRPFLMFIVENAEHILFFGKVTRP